MKKSKYFLYLGIASFIISCLLLLSKAFDIMQEENSEIKQFFLILFTITYVVSLLIYLIMRFILKK